MLVLFSLRKLTPVACSKLCLGYAVVFGFATALLISALPLCYGDMQSCSLQNIETNRAISIYEEDTLVSGIKDYL